MERGAGGDLGHLSHWETSPRVLRTLEASSAPACP